MLPQGGRVEFDREGAWGFPEGTVVVKHFELALPISVLVPAGMWWLLKKVLGIQLPSGMFGIG